MCGIVGYVGAENAVEIIVDSLKKLEYRGYDSAGVTILNSDLETYKTVGKISELEKIIPVDFTGHIGIGHTRWATHGKPDTKNAHPHLSSNIAVVHNGIIENYMHLKEKLLTQGYEFLSETDTEVIAHLLHRTMKEDAKLSLLDAVRHIMTEMEGSYAVAVLCTDEPEHIVLARKDSPLVIGLGDHGYYAASDVTAFLRYTRNAVYVNDKELVLISPAGVKFYNNDGQQIEKQIDTIEWNEEAAEKAGYEHFMLKEIHEQPTSIQDTYAGKIFELEGKVILDELKMDEDQLRSLQRVTIIACGTSWNAGCVGKYLFERLAGIHTDIETASEFRYGEPVLCGQVFTLAITQSGETADTLAAIRSSRSYGCKAAAITNVVGSTITRETDSVLFTRAGPEIGVAATKTFTAQLIVLYLMAIHMGTVRGRLSPETAREILVGIKQLPGQVQKILNNKDAIKACAEHYANVQDYFFIGRHLNYPVSLEGALKLKEISYIHAEGYAAGELKHGPLALLSSETPVVAIATKGHTYDKVLSNIKEVKARSAEVIAVANQSDTEIDKYVDTVLRIPDCHELLAPVLSSVVLQLLAYYTAYARGCSIDKPRNLAKSVTVE
ncbi:glucosamine--fructose-6-phosphate aminotransferase, isomerizing [Methanomethylovorans hollandica DSM 15978]|uniref:Glutamine--fructose-6-phosphate aminotransferase [isomerizing] n=1 Tax=Methanomethylovorans hollandica (strain DSM 15978 / NBRC 107637 / DMS1) TaxID=867904 RepID=L0L182_METHD|nr:glutamine--fructose-6-phosphate transaminase (isomerizing) [Methanomethylovorans hollandica]AGB50029.1 glucosamine--fructose-6-phosphate aminotransferase, isomerizing [Methanomethylovorans hollandica DSM 15978]